MVIGESANRDYFKVITPSFSYETTPWESRMEKQNPNFVFFTHGYSSFPQTIPSLKMALTEVNQYNGKEFFEAVNLVDMAKRAGYKVYWISNQGFTGKFNEGISVIAQRADVYHFINDIGASQEKYDEDLLPELEKINPTENNFIILHTMGGHSGYASRYPSGFNPFHANPKEDKDTAASYMNTVSYTDQFLEKVFLYGEKHLHMQMMVYFSDHGENIEYGHFPEGFTFDMVRIPMWIYLSEVYQKAYPNVMPVLREHASSYYTNDMMYNLMLALMQIRTNHYEAAYDLTSPHYQQAPESLYTMYGKVKISEDEALR